MTLCSISWLRLPYWKTAPPLAIQMNDMLVQTGAVIPLVYRGSVSAHHNSINGVAMNAWDSELWNIAEWTRSM